MVQEHTSDLAVPPPPHQRRPRVREVSSRFMSPSVQRRPISVDEFSETPFPVTCSVSQRKPAPQRSMKLLKENNNNGLEHPSKSCSGRIGGGNSNLNSTPCVYRPGTPIPTPSLCVSSRFRLTQPHHHHSNHHHHRFVNGMASAAEKLMQASGLNQAIPTSSSSTHDSGVVTCSIQSLPQFEQRDMVIQSNGGDLKFRHPSPLSRSVSLPSACEKQPLSSVSKLHASVNPLAKSGGLSLPPIPVPVPPQSVKPAMDVKKGKKGSTHQEDVHSLRFLYNRYLQWRFANAKAHSAIKSHRTESQKALYSQAIKISEMRDSVNKKRTELELLRRSKTLSTILEAQIPYLDEWSAMKEEYSVSITEAIQALMNASVQLPIGGNSTVDVRELGEALNSASKMMETMISNIQRFMPKAEETDISISELARVSGGERALIGECGDLLSKTYKSQLEECSLRGQLIQLHFMCHKNKNEE